MVDYKALIIDEGSDLSSISLFLLSRKVISGINVIIFINFICSLHFFKATKEFKRSLKNKFFKHIFLIFFHTNFRKENNNLFKPCLHRFMVATTGKYAAGASEN